MPIEISFWEGSLRDTLDGCWKFSFHFRLISFNYSKDYSSIFEYVENYGIIGEQYCCSIEESLFVDGSGSPCLSHILACQVGGTDR